MVRQAGTAFERIVESGRDGRFVIRPISNGEYQIEVIAFGFAMLSATARLPAGRVLALSLSPAPVVEAVQVVSASRQEELRETLNTNVAVLSRRGRAATSRRVGRKPSPSCSGRYPGRCRAGVGSSGLEDFRQDGSLEAWRSG